MIRALALVIVLTGALASPISVSPDTLRLLDSQGRERIFHGTNAVVKGPPWHPDHTSFSTDISMSEHDFDIMRGLGLNVLRLGIMWPGVEPTPGVYNESYLDQIDALVELASSRGIVTLLDMHQDGLSEFYCGEGLPTWAVAHTDKFNSDKFAFPAPFDSLAPGEYFADPAFYDTPLLPSRTACDEKNSGPGHSETTIAAADSYQALFTNQSGLLDRWAAVWSHLADRFNDRPEILGLELLNEPFAGDLYHHPLLMVPRRGDALNLQPAYDAIAKAVRRVNSDVLIFFAGVTWGDLGAGFTEPPDAKSVLAFHYYAPPQLSVPLQFRAQAREGKRLGVATFLTETSQPGPGQTGFDEPGGIGDGADTALVGWAGFEWKSFCRDSPTPTESQLGEWGACKTGYSSNWDGDMPSEAFQSANARTYAPAVAGTAVSMRFNVTSYEFELVYDAVTAVTAEGNPTEIFVWPGHYPNGFSLMARVSGGDGDVVATFDGVSSVHVVGDVSTGRRITVSISPSS